MLLSFAIVLGLVSLPVVPIDDVLPPVVEDVIPDRISAAESADAWTVGAGWYFYVYLNHQDINWIRGLAYTGATAAVCFVLATTVVASVACAAIAYVLWEGVRRLARPFPAHHCLEFKLNWGSFTFNSWKWVKRSC